MIDIGIEAEAAGGYARELTAEEKQKQHNALANAVAKSEVIICTAQIPGKPAPKIITEQMVLSMSPGSVIVDLAAETGGNCELTKPGEVVNLPKVSIHGPLNVPSLLSRDASNMYARNVVNFMKLLVTEGKINLDWQDPIIAQSVLTHDGEIKERKS